MSIFLCRAIVTKATLEQAQAKTEMQSERNCSRQDAPSFPARPAASAYPA